MRQPLALKNLGTYFERNFYRGPSLQLGTTTCIYPLSHIDLRFFGTSCFASDWPLNPSENDPSQPHRHTWCRLELPYRLVDGIHIPRSNRRGSGASRASIHSMFGIDG